VAQALMHGAHAGHISAGQQDADGHPFFYLHDIHLAQEWTQPRRHLAERRGRGIFVRSFGGEGARSALIFGPERLKDQHGTGNAPPQILGGMPL
jgi:hypothetical protein